MRTSRVRRHRAASRSARAPDRDEVRGHRAGPPGVGSVRGVEVAARPGSLRRRLGRRVVEGRAGGAQHDIGGGHRRGGRGRRLGAAPCPRRERHDDRVGAERQGRARQLGRDLDVGPVVDDDREPLAGPQPEVVAGDPLGDVGDGDRRGARSSRDPVTRPSPSAPPPRPRGRPGASAAGPPRPRPGRAARGAGRGRPGRCCTCPSGAGRPASRRP